MRPFREQIMVPKDASWVLYDRRLERIPFEWHYHPEYELTLTLDSRGQRFVGDSVARYEDGDLVLLGPRVPHTWCSGGRERGRWPRALVLWFSESFVQSMMVPHVEFKPVLRLLERSSRALSFSKAVREQARARIVAMVEQMPAQRMVSLLELLLLLAADRRATALASVAVEAAGAANAAEERVGRVIEYLHLHYREEVPVERLMRLAGLSRSSLHRLFKLHARTTLGGYVAQLRVGNACALLLNTQKPVALVADEVGYGNLSHFNARFKAIKGVTPRAFRAAFEAGNEMPGP